MPAGTAARFERLRAVYPLNGRFGAHPGRALRFFAELSPAEQEAAIAAAGVVARGHAETRRQPHNLDRWLDPNRGAGGLWRNAAPALATAAPSGSAPVRVFVRDGSPEWDAWAAHHRRIGRPMFVPTRSREHGADGWWFPAPFPSAAEAV